MKKSEPYNPGSDNVYINADKDHDIKGSIPKADFFNSVEQEIINAIKKAGYTPEDRNDQLGDAILKIAQNGLFGSVGDGLTIAAGVLKAVVAGGLKFDGGKIALNLHDSLQILNSQLAQAYLISLSKAEDMADNVIRPQITRIILRKSITAATTFTFDNSAIASVPDGTHVTLELHLNMKTVSAISFNPGVEWDGGKAPTMNKTRDYWLVLRTENKGTSWKASLGSDFNVY